MLGVKEINEFKKSIHWINPTIRTRIYNFKDPEFGSQFLALNISYNGFDTTKLQYVCYLVRRRNYPSSYRNTHNLYEMISSRFYFVKLNFSLYLLTT